MDKAAIKKWGTLLLLAAGAGIIFQLPYIRETFYPQIQSAMGLTNAQMGLLSSGYATMATLSYFIGGAIADRFSPRLMLTVSFRNGNSWIMVFYISKFQHSKTDLYPDGCNKHHYLLVSMYQGNKSTGNSRRAGTSFRTSGRSSRYH